MALEPVMISNIGSLIMAFVTGLISFKFWRTTQEEGIHTIEMLYKSFAFFALFQLVLGSRVLYPNLGSTELTGILIFAHMFLYISLAYFSRIATYIYKPDWTDYIFGSVLIAGALAMHVQISAWAQVVPAIAIPSLIVWIGMGTFVFLNMARNSEGMKRKKLSLMAVGFLIMAISGPLHGAASGPTQYILVEFFTVLGVVVIFSGVYYGKILRKDQ